MTLGEIAKLTDREKLQIMEALWEDMRKKTDEASIPPEHIETLESRRRALKAGEDKLHDWNEVEHSIGKR